jgi:hypothetical protein
MTKSYVKTESYCWNKLKRWEIFIGNWNRRKYVKETRAEKEIREFVKKEDKNEILKPFVF